MRIFSLTLGHTWADYFVGIMRVALTEGSFVGESLKELITDMRKAQRFDQLERNRLLEIRIANFTPILFLALFLFINFKVNTENAYLYYMVDPGGRNMILGCASAHFRLVFNGHVLIYAKNVRDCFRDY